MNNQPTLYPVYSTAIPGIVNTEAPEIPEQMPQQTKVFLKDKGIDLATGTIPSELYPDLLGSIYGKEYQSGAVKQGMNIKRMLLGLFEYWGHLELMARHYELGNGQIYYEAMGGMPSASTTKLAYGNVSSSSDASWSDADSWSIGAGVSTSGGMDTSDRDVQKTPYYKKYGINKLIITGYAKVTGSGTGSRLSTITTTIGPASASDSVSTTGWSQFTIEVDVSSLTNGQLYDITFNLEASISSAGIASATAYLQDRFIIIEQT